MNFAFRLSDRLSRMAPSATLAMSRKAQEMKAQGLDVVDMTVGELDFDTPRPVREAVAAAMLDDDAMGRWRQGKLGRYTPVPGIPELRAEAAAWAKELYGVDYPADRVVVGVGGKHILFNIFQVLLQEGDEVLIPSPYWVSYPDQVRLAGADPVIVPTDPARGFKLTPEALRAAIAAHPQARLLILNAPSNPAGVAYTRDELTALAAVVADSTLGVVADDIYSSLCYDGLDFTGFASLPGMAERTVVVHGLSKLFAMTGWRVGFCFAPAAVAKAVGDLQSQQTSNVPGASQWAAVAALKGRSALAGWANDVKTALAHRRGRIVEGLRAIPGLAVPAVPQGAFYVMPDVRGLYGRIVDGRPLINDLDVAGWWLEKAQVVGVPGTPFGAPGFVRLSFALADERLELAVSRLHALCTDAGAPR